MCQGWGSGNTQNRSWGRGARGSYAQPSRPGGAGGRSRRLARPSHALGQLRRPQHRALGAIHALGSRSPKAAAQGTRSAAQSRRLRERAAQGTRPLSGRCGPVSCKYHGGTQSSTALCRTVRSATGRLVRRGRRILVMVYRTGRRSLTVKTSSGNARERSLRERSSGWLACASPPPGLIYMAGSLRQ